MKDTIFIAKKLVEQYELLTDSKFPNSELKLQKLMYYVQKTSLALTGKPMFSEEFEGWIHGPVLPSLRFFLDGYSPENNDETELDDTDQFIINNAINEYGKYTTWALRDMTHEESAWLKSRQGLSDTERGSKKIPIEDIEEDALNMRIYDHEYDMYLDEFEDFEEGEFESV